MIVTVTLVIPEPGVSMVVVRWWESVMAVWREVLAGQASDRYKCLQINFLEIPSPPFQQTTG